MNELALRALWFMSQMSQWVVSQVMSQSAVFPLRLGVGLELGLGLALGLGLGLSEQLGIFISG